MILIKACVRNPASYQFYGVLGPKKCLYPSAAVGRSKPCQGWWDLFRRPPWISHLARDLFLKWWFLRQQSKLFVETSPGLLWGYQGLTPRSLPSLQLGSGSFFSMEIPLTFCTVYICIIFVYLPIFGILMNIEMWNLISCSPLAGWLGWLPSCNPSNALRISCWLPGPLIDFQFEQFWYHPILRVKSVES